MICPRRTSSVAKRDGRKAAAANRRRSSLRVCALAGLLLAAASAEQAMAADWSDLRGSFSAAPVRWDGVYFGAQAGVANSDTDFSKTTSDFVSFSLRETALQSEIKPSNWSVMPSEISHGRSYGGFGGYNYQWDQLVVSGELAYNRASGLDPSAFGTITRIVAPSTGSDTVTITGQEAMKLNDYATFRARGGYAFGQFLPYAFVGGAVGRFNYARDLFLKVSGADNGTYTLTDGKNDAIVAGFTAGLGIDIAILPNAFLRAEWEYVGFAPVVGIRTSVNTGRVGIAVRF